VYPPGLVVRTSNPRATLAIEEAIRRIDPAVRPTVALLAVSIESFLEGPRRLAWLLGPPALLALALAALGVFGVVSFVANQRTGEVCVRMALGATSGDIWRMTMVDGLRPVVIGLVVGLGLALLAGQWLGSNFRLSSAHDPAAIAGAALLLLGSTLAAVAIPAARAARTEPAGLLRQG
jgi:predicted lysophospholipase L1 biosynthesis ABC-type transport system permease subunit